MITKDIVLWNSMMADNTWEGDKMEGDKMEGDKMEGDKMEGQKIIREETESGRQS